MWTCAHMAILCHQKYLSVCNNTVRVYHIFRRHTCIYFIKKHYKVSVFLIGEFGDQFSFAYVHMYIFKKHYKVSVFLIGEFGDQFSSENICTQSNSTFFFFIQFNSEICFLVHIGEVQKGTKPNHLQVELSFLPPTSVTH